MGEVTRKPRARKAAPPAPLDVFDVEATVSADLAPLGLLPDNKYTRLALGRHRAAVRAASGPVVPDEWTCHFVRLAQAEG